MVLSINSRSTKKDAKAAHVYIILYFIARILYVIGYAMGAYMRTGVLRELGYGMGLILQIFLVLLGFGVDLRPHLAALYTPLLSYIK